MKRKKLITILLPCLNEEQTLLECINNIKKSMNKSKYKDKYNILVCDNNSTDNSIKICIDNKIDYVICKEKGYGATLRNGINKAESDYIVMLDSDCSYDEKDIPKLINKLEEGYDLVIGNRFKGTIEKKAMPKSHSIGSRTLTKYANILFHTKTNDYHCGLRAFKRETLLKCNLITSGFEFASEMIIKAKINKLKITEIPTNLYKDKRNKKPHLKAIKDGIRHLALINKLKFNNSKLFKYTTTYLLTMIILFTFLFLSQLIPHYLIKDNTIKSIKEMNIIFKKEKLKKSNYIYEKAGDIRLLSMIYSENENNPLKSLIEMNYYEKCDYNIQECDKTLIEKKGKLIEYSRYWHGQTILEKTLLIFTTIKTINIINLILILLLLLFTSIKIYKIDKFLAFAFLATILSTNIIFMTTSMQYIPIMYVTLITSNILITLINKKSQNIDLLFLISGITTCFFDFLTTETLSLTIPLILYIYIMNKKQTLNHKEIIRFALLWLLGYSTAFITKWIICCIHYGPKQIINIANSAKIRIIDNTQKNYIYKILKTLSQIIPFDILNNGGIIGILLLLTTAIYNLIYNKKNLIYYTILLVPIMRFIILSAHSFNFYYFTYRAFSIIIFLILFTIYDMMKEIIGVDMHEKKEK